MGCTGSLLRLLVGHASSSDHCTPRVGMIDITDVPGNLSVDVALAWHGIVNLGQSGGTAWGGKFRG